MAERTGKVVEGSFHIEQEVELAVPRERAWATLVDVGGWWSHHFAATKPKLRLDARLGGQFREEWGDGEGALWGTVIFIRKPEVLRLSGPLGMHTPVNSVYEFGLKEQGAGTLLTLTHRCIGLIDSGWKDAHDKGWRELWTHLKALAETGTRYQA
jgi:uncharacterized protein YndB with AHSA1/START domain